MSLELTEHDKRGRTPIPLASMLPYERRIMSQVFVEKTDGQDAYYFGDGLGCQIQLSDDECFALCSKIVADMQTRNPDLTSAWVQHHDGGDQWRFNRDEDGKLVSIEPIDDELKARHLASQLGYVIREGVPYDRKGEWISEYCLRNPYSWKAVVL